jgi:predicted  nucleic acid-binding Zn ribbon protein
MYAFDIVFKNKNLNKENQQQYDYWVSYAYDYVCFLERSGQVLKNNHHVIINNNTIRIPVICPEKNSLTSKNNSIYANKVIKKLGKNNGCSPEFIYTGRDADNINYKVPENSSSYILYSGLESPLYCGDTFKPIPLYKILETDHDGDDYDNINFWNKDYQRLYGLWLSSRDYEGFAQEQLQEVHSPINTWGRELCEIIEKITGVPTYYFLFNYRVCTEQQDKQRKCPITGNDWYFKGKTSSDFFAFKCEESRLVSELSTNSSDSDDE